MRVFAWMVAMFCTSSIMAMVPVEKVAKNESGMYVATFPKKSIPSIDDQERGIRAVLPFQLLENMRKQSGKGEEIESVVRMTNGLSYKVTFAGPQPLKNDVERAAALVRFLMTTEVMGETPFALKYIQVEQSKPILKRVLVIAKE